MQGSAQYSSIKLQEKSLSSQSSALGTFLHLKQTPHCTSPKGFSSSNSSPTKTVGPKACFFLNTSRILMLGCAFSVCAICAMNPLSFFLPDLSLGGSFNPASSFFFFLSWYCFFRPGVTSFSLMLKMLAIVHWSRCVEFLWSNTMNLPSDN